MKIYPILLLCVCLNMCWASNPIGEAPVPDWVESIDYPPGPIMEDNGGGQYLLIDLQDNLILQTRFRHYAFKILTNEGVQSMSDIEVSFDPSYQALNFHYVRIIRAGKTIEKLALQDFQVLQRETRKDRALYDGSLSAILDLTDVREFDIIEYAYSLKGFNPINKGHYGQTFYHEMSTPFNRMYNRLTVKSGTSVSMQQIGGASAPEIERGIEQTTYTWDVQGLEYQWLDSNVPSWFNPRKRIELSTFQSWEEVVNWALPLYVYKQQRIPKLQLSLPDTATRADKILATVRFVQDEVRYLGFESGISAYKPHSPQTVFTQRYGDCKDKSLLLVALLRAEGLEAHPLLVNTYLNEHVQERLPSYYAFNHCVVFFEFEGDSIFVDPTISNQGGSLKHIAFPHYRKGLLIKPGETALIALPEPTKPQISVREILDLEEVGGEAKLKVITSFLGGKADFYRSYFQANAKEYIQKNWADYYRALYPKLELLEPIQLIDDYRNSTNELITIETYRIEDVWEPSEDSLYLFAEIYPLVLESYVDIPKSGDRTMPYYLGEPIDYAHSSQVNLPSDLWVEAENQTISGEGFTYEFSVIDEGETLFIKHNYELLKDHIDGEQFEDFLEKHGTIMEGLSYYVSYDNPSNSKSTEDFKLSWISALIGLIGLAVAGYFIVKLYHTYDPKPAVPEPSNLQIEGLLILPAIGITLGPFALFLQLFTGGHYHQDIWAMVAYLDVKMTFLYCFIVGIEILFNISYLLFSVLIFLQFYQRRTSLPRLYSIYLIAGFLFPFLANMAFDFLIVKTIPEWNGFWVYSDTAIFRTFIYAAIWVPYFNLSSRVKNTFCKRVESELPDKESPSDQEEVLTEMH